MAYSQDEHSSDHSDFEYFHAVCDPDPLQDLLSVVLEVQKSQWRKEEYNRILFCQIKDLKHFELLNTILYNKNLVFTSQNYNTFSNEECNFEIPIVHVLFCGIIINSEVEGDYHWFEIGSGNDTILCRADHISSTDLQDDIRNRYYHAHKKYRDAEKKFKTNQSPIEKQAMNESYLLWLLQRRSKELTEKSNEVQLKSKRDVKNRNVIVIGKLWQKHNKKFVIIKQCKFVSEKTEKHVLEMIRLQKLHML